MDSIKFTWALQSVGGNNYKLHSICDGEIVYKNDYTVHSIDKIVWGGYELWNYRLKKDNRNRDVNVRMHQSLSRFKSTMYRRESCSILVQMDNGYCVDITTYAIYALGIRRYIDNTTCKNLEKRAAVYDRYAPPKDVPNVTLDDVMIRLRNLNVVVGGDV